VEGLSTNTPCCVTCKGPLFLYSTLVGTFGEPKCVSQTRGIRVCASALKIIGVTLLPGSGLEPHSVSIEASLLLVCAESKSVQYHSILSTLSFKSTDTRDALKETGLVDSGDAMFVIVDSLDGRLWITSLSENTAPYHEQSCNGQLQPKSVVRLRCV
jgi:hypothetical protein